MLAFSMKAGHLDSGVMIEYLLAVISIACKPTCRRVERLVPPHWCAAELRALRWAIGQSGSG
jgi:hypothetical protein